MTDHDKIVDRIVKDSKEEFYENFDAAVDRWLTKQFAKFGRWTLMGAAAAVFVWGVKVYFASGGLK